MDDLATVSVPGSATAEVIASEILEAWDRALVVHVQGLSHRSNLFDLYDQVCTLIGTPAEIAEDATAGDREHQRTHQRWMQVRFDPSIPDAYRHSSSAQPLHTDGSYIPGFPSATMMFCVSAARRGGETVFLPGSRLVAILERRAPDLLGRLRAEPVRHRRSGDERTETVIATGEHGEFLVNWNYYCVDPNSGRQTIELADEFFQFLGSDPDIATSLVPVGLQPGEAVIWKDRRLIHGRQAFQANDVSERFIWKCAVDVGVWHPVDV